MLAQVLGIAVVVLVLVAILTIIVRRWVLGRVGGIDLCWRTNLRPNGTGWILGQGRFGKHELHLYRSFSPLPSASRRLPRRGLELGERRAPVGTEPDLLHANAVIVRCTDGGAPFELALSEQALTGLRSWLESLPPGTATQQGFYRRRGDA